MHPLWQARQPVRFDGLLHIDHNAVFGNRASGKLWCTFFALVGWAAAHERGLEDLHQYVDDTFGFEFNRTLVRYEPYDTSYPEKQAHLLELWDEIGLIHDETMLLPQHGVTNKRRSCGGRWRSARSFPAIRRTCLAGTTTGIRRCSTSDRRVSTPAYPEDRSRTSKSQVVIFR